MTDSTSAKRQRGFSLAEVLVAVALMVVILLALFGLVTAGVRRAYSGKKMTEASVLAQHVMERVNVYESQALLGLAAADYATRDTPVVLSWTRGATTLPVAEGTADTLAIERDEIRNLLVNADMPATAADPATLSITATPLPTGKNFGNCSMVRITVDFDWTEWGTRRRQVRLQALNLRTQP